jgi:hypothetical protein
VLEVPPSTVASGGVCQCAAESVRANGMASGARPAEGAGAAGGVSEGTVSAAEGGTRCDGAAAAPAAGREAGASSLLPGV